MPLNKRVLSGQATPQPLIMTPRPQLQIISSLKRARLRLWTIASDGREVAQHENLF